MFRHSIGRMAHKSFSLVKEGPWFGVRHTQLLFLFTLRTFIFYTRTITSIGIVAMTNANTTNIDFPEFHWSSSEKSYILSSTSWGGTCVYIFAGYLSSQFGAKQFLLVCTLIVAVFSLLTPAATIYGGWQMLTVVRFLQSMVQCSMLPFFFTHLTQWSPVNERNRLGGITEAGIDFGYLLGYIASGLIAASNLGWPGMFYIPSGVGILWSILWAFFGANSASESKIISITEKEIVLASVTESVGNKPVPWKAIFTSVPFWALIVTRVTFLISFFTLEQQIPSYIHGIFKLSIEKNAVYSALPHAFTFCFCFVNLILADVLTDRYNVRLAVVRKIFSSIACWIPAVALLLLGYLSVDLATSITLLIIAQLACSAQAIGSYLNHIDLSPNYSGILFGITNTLASVFGLFSPLLVGIVVSDDSDPYQWRMVFTAVALTFFFGNLFYIIFGKMEKQSWDDGLGGKDAASLPTNLQ